MFRLIVTLVPTISLLWWYFADRGLRQNFPGSRWPRIALALFVLFHVGYIGFRIMGRTSGWDYEPPLFVNVPGYVWNMVLVPFVLLPLSVVLFCGRVGSAIKRAVTHPTTLQTDEPVEPEAATRLSRRQLIAASIAVAPPAMSVIGSGIAATQLDNLKTREFGVPVRDLPAELEGLRIVHLSDLHVGRFTGTEVLDKMITDTMALKPDIIVVTGDIIDYAMKDLPQAIAAIKRLDAPHGVYLCEGNHDLFEDTAGFRQQVIDSGLRLLLNEWSIIDVRGHRIDIGGIAWRGTDGGRRGNLPENMRALLARRTTGAALSLLLAHHPHAFDEASAADIAVTFSGHTHGGQLMLTNSLGAGPAMFKYWSGLYQKATASLLVSNGVGNWMPLRINAPAEIIIATLRRS